MKRTRLSIYDDFPTSRIDAMINEWIHSERDRAILHYKLIDGLTYQKILEKDFPGKETCTSIDTVKDVIRKAEKKLYNHLIVDEKKPV